MKQCRLALFVILLACACACAFVFACGKTSPSDGTPVVTNYATEILSLPATARDHWQIYQVNPKLYESGRVLFVLYENGGLLAVNVSGNEVEASFPEPVSGKSGVPTSQKFGAYQFQVWE